MKENSPKIYDLKLLIGIAQVFEAFYVAAVYSEVQNNMFVVIQCIVC
jgi:hypothetical protein